jgi:SAM-dependent methyltransferase
VDWSTRYGITRALILQFAPDGQLFAAPSLSREPRRMQVDAVPVVASFAPPRTIAEAFDKLSADYEFDREGFQIVVGELIAAGAITAVDASDRFVPGEQGFASLEAHAAMLRDIRRVQSYQIAIERAARGKTVVEIGCGTGILSLFAAKAGARKVYAFEETTIADVALDMFAANGVADRIEIVRGNSMDMSLPERCDLLIHEIIGTEPIGENVLPVIDDARERFLAPGGQLLPYQLDLCLVGIEHSRTEELFDDAISLEEVARIYGVDLGPFVTRLRKRRATRPLGPPNEVIDARHVMTSEATFATIDLRKPWEPQIPDKTEVVLDVMRAGRIGGVASLFRAHLDERTVLGNQPWLPVTSWGFAWKGFPAAASRISAAGDRLVLETAVERTARQMLVTVTPKSP